MTSQPEPHTGAIDRPTVHSIGYNRRLIWDSSWLAVFQTPTSALHIGISMEIWIYQNRSAGSFSELSGCVGLENGRGDCDASLVIWFMACIPNPWDIWQFPGGGEQVSCGTEFSVVLFFRSCTSVDCGRGLELWVENGTPLE